MSPADLISPAELTIRTSTTEELPELQAIREAAFAPVFASFRSLLGDRVYAVAQASDDDAQGELLASFFEPDSVWEVFSAELDGRLVGFMAIRLDRETGVAELGLNAVHPEARGQGIGTALYEFALDRMSAEGMEVAIVGTGGDPSHAPARRAYAKAGFDRELPTVWMYCDLKNREPGG